MQKSIKVQNNIQIIINSNWELVLSTLGLFKMRFFISRDFYKIETNLTYFSDKWKKIAHRVVATGSRVVASVNWTTFLSVILSPVKTALALSHIRLLPSFERNSERETRGLFSFGVHLAFLCRVARYMTRSTIDKDGCSMYNVDAHYYKDVRHFWCYIHSMQKVADVLTI